MKRTGPSNPNTAELLVQLDKHGKKSKQHAYQTLSELLKVATRQRAEVDLEHLNHLAQIHQDKILVVPGKVLSDGKVTQPIEVAAFRITQNAKKKIEEAKGKTHNLRELIQQNTPGKKLVLVK